MADSVSGVSSIFVQKRGESTVQDTKKVAVHLSSPASLAQQVMSVGQASFIAFSLVDCKEFQPSRLHRQGRKVTVISTPNS